MLTQDRTLFHRWEFPVLGQKPFRILQGSDHHVPLDLAATFTYDLIVQARRDADLIILNGDLFHALHGESSQNAIGGLLNALSDSFPGPIIYVPGNHDLRGSRNPWKNFGELPDNVKAPLDDPMKPVELFTRAGKIVAGNIFYDLDFIPPQLVGHTKESLEKFYHERLVDGRHLFGGDMSLFPDMTRNFARKITPDVKFVVTHALPHPSLTHVRSIALEAAAAELLKPLGVEIIDGGLYDDRHHESPFESGMWWNSKAPLMGSNLLAHEEANPCDGLVVFYGHNHRSENRVQRVINGKTITFCSYQYPCTSDGEFRWSRSGVPTEAGWHPPGFAPENLHL